MIAIPSHGNASRSHFHRTAILLGVTLGAATLSMAHARQPSAPATLDSLFAEVAAIAPAFGGAYFDASGTLQVQVESGGKPVSASTCARVVDALSAVLGKDRVRRPLGDPRHAGGRSAWKAQAPACRGARFGFARLAEWRQRARKVFEVPGVVSVDIDETRNAIAIGVDDVKRVAGDVYRLLDAAGVPGVAVDVEQSLQLRYLQSGSVTATEHRPVFGGVEIGDTASGSGVCTLGPNVRVPGWFGDTRGFLTNSHCAPNIGGPEQSVVEQPRGGERIGVEWIDPPFSTGSDCPPGRYCRWSDSAIVMYDGDVADRFARIARTHYPDGALTLDPDFPLHAITGESWIVLVNDVLQKIGSRGGWGAGYVTATCVDLGPANSDEFFFCQNLVQAPMGYDAARPGDSGAPVFVWQGQEWVSLVGLLWSGFVDPANPDFATTYVYSPLPNLRADLGMFHTHD